MKTTCRSTFDINIKVELPFHKMQSVFNYLPQIDPVTQSLYSKCPQIQSTVEDFGVVTVATTQGELRRPFPRLINTDLHKCKKTDRVDFNNV